MSASKAERLEAVIVGAGFAGLYTLHRMNRLGLEAVVIEAAGGIGGTWYWNTYPGARCDVESFEYSYSFDEELEQSWHWSERYARQPEILRYLEHVADRYDLRPRIRLNTRVESAHWQDGTGSWHVDTSSGPVEAHYLLLATGCLSRPHIPKIEGLASFEGQLFHSSRWPQGGIDLHGKRVGVIGTGSSGVQIVSNIASDVEHLHVFQRTPHWVVPAGNRAIDAEEEKRVKRNYRAFREQLAGSLLGMSFEPGGGSANEATEEVRQARYEARWQNGGGAFLLSFDDLLFDMDANATACAFLAGKIRSIVEEPATAEALIPDATRYPIGARRIVIDDGYYERFNRPNVDLMDLRKDPISEITATGIVQRSGRRTELDVIVLATGFDALTGALLDIEIVGEDGVELEDKWSEGPLTYLGLATHGFPNLFMITGPGSPSVFSNVVLSIEQHVDFVADLIAWMRQRRLQTTEPDAASERQWGERVLQVAKPTVLMNVDSWYWGVNVAGKPRAFLPYLGGVGTYRDECSEVANHDYAGFAFSAADDEKAPVRRIGGGDR